MTYPTDIHGPAATAPEVTGKYAVCDLCGTQWQIKSFVNTDAQGCQFCGADKSAVHIFREDENSG
jgi:hypothetical protein